jgi:hypothetical protein
LPEAVFGIFWRNAHSAGNSMPDPPKSIRQFTCGEYFLPGPTSRQTWEARWEFILSGQRLLPSFFTRLRDDVLPEFKRLAEGRSEYFEQDWRYNTWTTASDQNKQFEPLLLAWAQCFHVDGEDWILEGAIRSLNLWCESTDYLRQPVPDIHRFQTLVAEESLLSDEEWLRLDFLLGWDPQTERWSKFRKRIFRDLKAGLRSYEQRQRNLVEVRGGKRIRYRYSQSNIDWFVHYQLEGLSYREIADHYASNETVDENAVSHGIHTVVALLDWKRLRRKNRKVTATS